MFVTTRSLDHHGIVSGTYDELEIGTVIDELLPKFGQHKLAHSIVVKPEFLLSYIKPHQKTLFL